MRNEEARFMDADGRVVRLAAEVVEAIENDFKRPLEEIPSWEVEEWLEG